MGLPLPLSLIAPLLSHCFTGGMLRGCALWFLCNLSVGAPFCPPTAVPFLYTGSRGPLLCCSPLLHPPFVLPQQLTLGSVCSDDDLQLILFLGNWMWLVILPHSLQVLVVVMGGPRVPFVPLLPI